MDGMELKEAIPTTQQQQHQMEEGATVLYKRRGAVDRSSRRMHAKKYVVKEEAALAEHKSNKDPVVAEVTSTTDQSQHKADKAQTSLHLDQMENEHFLTEEQMTRIVAEKHPSAIIENSCKQRKRKSRKNC